MTATNLFIAKLVFKNHEAGALPYIQYVYCIEASSDKLAYQKALILASEMFQSLNNDGVYSFIGLQELSRLNQACLPAPSLASQTILALDELHLKQYQNSLIHTLSESLV